MITIAWNHLCFYVVEVLSRAQKFGASHYIEHILRPILELRPKSGQWHLAIHEDNIVWYINTCASSVWWNWAELTYILKLFIIWRSLHCIGLLLKLAAPKPEICYSFLVDQYPSKSFADTQKTGPRQLPESVRVLFNCKKQVKVTEGQIRWIGWVWYAANAVHQANLLKPDLYELSNCQDEP
jgi:hypothetical protein